MPNQNSLLQEINNLDINNLESILKEFQDEFLFHKIACKISTTSLSEEEINLLAEYLLRYKEAAESDTGYDLYTWLDYWFGISQYTKSESSLARSGIFKEFGEEYKNNLTKTIKTLADRSGINIILDPSGAISLPKQEEKILTEKGKEIKKQIQERLADINIALSSKNISDMKNFLLKYSISESSKSEIEQKLKSEDLEELKQYISRFKETMPEARKQIDVLLSLNDPKEALPKIKEFINTTISSKALSAEELKRKDEENINRKFSIRIEQEIDRLKKRIRNQEAGLYSSPVRLEEQTGVIPVSEKAKIHQQNVGLLAQIRLLQNSIESNTMELDKANKELENFKGRNEEQISKLESKETPLSEEGTVFYGEGPRYDLKSDEEKKEEKKFLEKEEERQRIQKEQQEIFEKKELPNPSLSEESFVETTTSYNSLLNNKKRLEYAIDKDTKTLGKLTESAPKKEEKLAEDKTTLSLLEDKEIPIEKKLEILGINKSEYIGQEEDRGFFSELTENRTLDTMGEDQLESLFKEVASMVANVNISQDAIRTTNNMILRESIPKYNKIIKSYNDLLKQINDSMSIYSKELGQASSEKPSSEDIDKFLKGISIKKEERKPKIEAIGKDLIDSSSYTLNILPKLTKSYIDNIKREDLSRIKQLTESLIKNPENINIINEFLRTRDKIYNAYEEHDLFQVKSLIDSLSKFSKSIKPYVTEAKLKNGLENFKASIDNMAEDNTSNIFDFNEMINNFEEVPSFREVIKDPNFTKIRSQVENTVIQAGKLAKEELKKKLVKSLEEFKSLMNSEITDLTKDTYEETEGGEKKTKTTSVMKQINNNIEKIRDSYLQKFKDLNLDGVKLEGANKDLLNKFLGAQTRTVFKIIGDMYDSSYYDPEFSQTSENIVEAGILGKPLLGTNKVKVSRNSLPVQGMNLINLLIDWKNLSLKAYQSINELTKRTKKETYKSKEYSPRLKAENLGASTIVNNQLMDLGYKKEEDKYDAISGLSYKINKYRDDISKINEDKKEIDSQLRNTIDDIKENILYRNRDYIISGIKNRGNSFEDLEDSLSSDISSIENFDEFLKKINWVFDELYSILQSHSIAKKMDLKSIFSIKKNQIQNLIDRYNKFNSEKDFFEQKLEEGKEQELLYKFRYAPNLLTEEEQKEIENIKNQHRKLREQHTTYKIPKKGK